MTEVTLRRANDGALAYVETLLERNDLPVEDVRSKPDCFHVSYGSAASDEDDASDERVGVGGIEQFGTDALLRSVVVEESVRGRGVGTALCDTLESEARSEGVETLYLLTTTAAEFFESRGYAPIERSDAPAPVQETTEFADLCPTTATCMRKWL